LILNFLHTSMFDFPVYYGNYLDLFEKSKYQHFLWLYQSAKKHH